MIKFLLGVFWFFFALIAPFVLSCLLWAFYFIKIKKMPIIKNEKGKYKEHSKLRRLLIDFPKRVALDRIQTDPNTFQEYGMHLICGEQGSGKTTCMAYLTRKYKTIYPKLKVRSNFDCKIQDFSLESWEDLTLDTNGVFGELDLIDEVQNWFSSNASKNFPPDMLTIITQQRKVRRCILATSQIFTRVAKPIRENTYLMYYPFTIAGAITFVRVYKPILDSEGYLTDKKLKKFFFFVHDEELRGLFDSYKTICTLRESGFKDSCEQLASDTRITATLSDQPKPRSPWGRRSAR